MTASKIAPVHPGEILVKEFLDPLGISKYRLAKDIGVPAPRVNDIALCRRGITADSALRLGRYFGTGPEFWLNIQTRYDLEVARDAVGARIEAEVKPRAA